MLHVALMVGGSGTRFWPLSRTNTPKYLLPIVGQQSMLEQTVARVAPMVSPERIYCVTSRTQAPAIRRAMFSTSLLPITVGTRVVLNS